MEGKEKTGGRFSTSYQGGSSRNPDTRNAYQRWVATLAQHEPYVTSEMVKRMLENFKCDSYAFQLEEGALLGKRHFQMRFTLTSRATKSRLLSQAQMSFRIWTGLGTIDAANWVSDLTISQERGTVEDSKAYCTKPEGRVEGPFSYPYEYAGEDLIEIAKYRSRMEGLLSWTDDLMDIWADNDFGPSTPTNDRSIYWICDPRGGTRQIRVYEVPCL